MAMVAQYKQQRFQMTKLKYCSFFVSLVFWASKCKHWLQWDFNRPTTVTDARIARMLDWAFSSGLSYRKMIDQNISDEQLYKFPEMLNIP